jgi:hypothetical protein
MRKFAIIAAVAVAACAANAANTITGTILAKSTITYSKAIGTASTLNHVFDDFVRWSVTTGTNANQMTAICYSTDTLANGQTNTLYLSAIADGFGDAKAFTAVRFIALQAATNNVDAVRLGGAETDAFAPWAGSATDTALVMPGGTLIMMAPQLAGFAVGTATNLNVSCVGTNEATYYLYIGGSE